jgi:hypothetical protein
LPVVPVIVAISNPPLSIVRLCLSPILARHDGQQSAPDPRAALAFVIDARMPRVK